MKQIDLHVHSSFSDGTFSPTELIHLAAEKGLAAIALTDHDTVLGVNEALEASLRLHQQGTKIKVIPGVEISAGYQKHDIHILGLYIDHTNPHLLKQLDLAVKNREERNIKMAENLRNAGLAITIEELQEADPHAILTRAHFAKLLYKKGYVKDIKDAFKKYLNENGPYYVERNYMTPEAAISLIREAGGLAALAHPLLYRLSIRDLKALLLRLKKAGLTGLEAIYSNNVSNEEAFVRSLARKYNLLITGGSDFHGSIKPSISLGSGRGNLKVPASLLKDLEQALPRNQI